MSYVRVTPSISHSSPSSIKCTQNNQWLETYRQKREVLDSTSIHWSPTAGGTNLVWVQSEVWKLAWSHHFNLQVELKPGWCNRQLIQLVLHFWADTNRFKPVYFDLHNYQHYKQSFKSLTAYYMFFEKLNKSRLFNFSKIIRLRMMDDPTSKSLWFTCKSLGFKHKSLCILTIHYYDLPMNNYDLLVDHCYLPINHCNLLVNQ